MKILLLSVRPDERAAIEKWGNRHPDVALTIAEWNYIQRPWIRWLVLTG
nr:hypothetical protein [Weissella paramesenteroides]